MTLSRILSTIFLIVALVAAYGLYLVFGGERIYYGHTPAGVCREIAFSCPQYQQSFRDFTGCGCVPQADQSDSEIASLRSVIDEYLAKHFGTADAAGEPFAAYVLLDGVEDPATSELDYQVFTVIQNYKVVDGQLVAGEAHTLPVALAITQTNQNYIVHGHRTAATPDDYAETFTPTTVAWLTDESENAAQAAVTERLKVTAYNSAQEHYLAELIEALTNKADAPDVSAEETTDSTAPAVPAASEPTAADTPTSLEVE
jgi:hypothetical protein